MSVRQPEEHGSPTPVDGRCNARITGTGPDFPDVEERYCMNRPVKGRNRCKFHGGMTPKGIDHYKVRRAMADYHGVALPARLREAFESLTTTADATSLIQEILLLRALLAEDLSKLSAGVSWDAVQDEAQAVQRWLDKHGESLPDEDREALTASIEGLWEAIEAGVEEDKVVDKIVTKLRALKDMADTENKRDYMRDKAISEKEAALLFSAVINTVYSNVRDEEDRARTLSEIRRLLLGRGTAEMIEAEVIE